MANFLKLNNGVVQGTSMVLTDLPSIATATVLGNTSGITGTPTALTTTGTGDVVFSASPTFTGTIGAAAITLSSALTVASGGTGDASFTAYAPIVGGTTTTGTLQSATTGLSTTGLPFITNGSSALPSFQTLGVAGGGTGQTSLTAYSLIAAGTTTTGALQQVTNVGATNGQVLTYNGTSSLPTWQSLGTGTYTAPTVSSAGSSGIGTGGFLVNAANYGYVFTITSASAVANDVYQSSSTCTITNASPAVITNGAVAHNLQINMPISLSTTGSLPTGLSPATTYYVSSIPSTTSFQVAAYIGGPSLNTSSAGSGTQSLLIGSYTVSSSTTTSPRLVTGTPSLVNIGPAPTTTTTAIVSNIVPQAPPVSGTLARVSGTGPATITFSNAQFYNSGYAGTLFTITAATASAADVYQDQKTVTITIAAPAVATTSVAHGLIVGQPVAFTTTGALPTGITASTTYFVSAVPAVTTFQISTTQGGSSLTTTGTQSGTHTVDMASYTVATGAGITSFTSLFTTQASGYQPGVSGTLTKLSGAGGSTSSITYSLGQALATYTVPTSPRSPLYLELEMIGGGGGGGGNSTSGSAGLSSIFGTNFIYANGGAGGVVASNASVGGTVIASTSGITQLVLTRGSGGGPGTTFNSNVVNAQGGNGGPSPFGGAGGGGVSIGAGGTAASPNSGAGGGGAGGGAGATNSGAGGACGGYYKGIITSFSATYLYIVGLGGNGGSTGSGAGGSGIVNVKEFYQ